MADKPPIKDDMMYLNQHNDWNLYYCFAKELGMNEETAERYADKMIVNCKNLRLLHNRYNDQGSSLSVDLNTTLVGR